MVNTNLKINFKILNKDTQKVEDVEKNIVLQEVSPFRTTDVFSSAINPQTSRYNMGMVVEQLIDIIVVAPTDLKELIEEADNALDVITELFLAFKEFCDCPRLYALKQIERQSKAKTKDMEHGTSELDTNGSEEHE